MPTCPVCHKQTTALTIIDGQKMCRRCGKDRTQREQTFQAESELDEMLPIPLSSRCSEIQSENFLK